MLLANRMVHVPLVLLLLVLVGVGTVVTMSVKGDDDKAEYTALIGKIGGHKRYLSKLGNNIQPFLDVAKLEGSQLVEAEQLESLIRTRVDLLQNFFDDLLDNPHTTEEDIDGFEQYRTGITSKLAKLTFKLGENARVPLLNDKHNDSLGSTKKGWGDSAVKFPELSLPKFSGGDSGENEFRPFKQLFDALVGGNEDIPLIYKVQYLRGCLPDGSEAKRLIAHIPPTEESYDIIMGILVSRYGTNSGEANRLRRKLMEVGEWSVCHTIDAQRGLIEHVRTHLSLLNQVETVRDEEMTTLGLHILAAVPERIRYKVAKLEKHDRTVENIVKVIEKSIASKLEVQSFSPSHNSQTYGVGISSSSSRVFNNQQPRTNNTNNRQKSNQGTQFAGRGGNNVNRQHTYSH